MGVAASVPVPPFEVFYEEHRDEVLAFLRRRVGRERADDAFQETFLRALRAYPRLEHGLHLRAWVLTIASRLVIDLARKRSPEPSDPSNSLLQGLETWDERHRPAFEELADLADGLPPKEKAAVVLRYGYDLDYAQIGAALGSTEAAARQAASAGVRRLRRELNA
jgi:RNA polymerase sigma factor (sigma-70 family)